jgi:hypothetical protein
VIALPSASASDRLTLLHHIAESPDLLTLHDRFALLGGALPDDPLVRQRWDQLASALILAGAV